MIILGPDGQPTDRDRARWAQTPTGLLVPGHVVHKPIGVDLFAGCGGFSLGMHQAGFHVAAAVELDFSAVLTYAVNLARPGVEFHFDTDERADEFDAFLARYMGLDAPKTKPRKKKGARKTARVVEAPAMAGDGWIKDQPLSEEGCKHIWVGDVRTLTGAEILDALGVDEVDVVFGGPPCQGFSFAGKRNVMDPRNSLIFEFARLVLELRARTMAMENVPGILDMRTEDGQLVIEVFTDILETGGFSTKDALRRALTGRAGSARVANRGTGPAVAKQEKKKPARVARAEAPPQLGLFAEG